ncbi:DUF3194 domain-containing protein [Halobacteriales archaeon QS_1_68_20]|nr:MAG: DUF3194 domain-containing protein [Halobacteriales archaeon QS_1_68_20]
MADADSTADPTDEEVVEAAATAAEDVVFSRYDRSTVEDYDVCVTFEDGILEVDVYVDAGDDDEEARVADDAALAARAAVDELFEAGD